jgi:hypothetical protein
MWSDLKSFLSDIADIIFVVFVKFWVIFKWLVIFLTAVAVRLGDMLVVFFLVSADLVSNHYIALLTTVPILFVGFLATNKLQKKKFFISIPWYQNPIRQPLLQIPIIFAVLGLLVCGGPISISPTTTKSLVDSLGPVGHLGIPDTIWAALISVVLAWVAGVVALKEEEKTHRVIKDDKGEEEKI